MSAGLGITAAAILMLTVTTPPQKIQTAPLLPEPVD
jgi:hypothetical protein